MPHQVAGTEVYTWALAKSLQQKGHDVTIVIPNYKSSQFNTYEYDGLFIRRYPEPDTTDRLLIMGKRAPAGISDFVKLIQQLQPDIVHVQELAGSNGIGIYHLRALKERGIKIVFTMHLAYYSCFCGTLMYKGKEHCNGLIDIKRCTKCALSKLPIEKLTQQILYNLSMPLYKMNVNTGKLNHSAGTALSYPFIIKERRSALHEIAALCDKIIVLTDWYKNVLLKNGIKENKLRLVKQALPYKADFSDKVTFDASLPVRLIFVGRIDPLKGLHLLLEAMKDLPEDKIHLTIYGAVIDKQYSNYWKQHIGYKGNIHWKGLLQQNEVVNTIRKHHALVLPSTFSEMSPLVIQEAFAAGVPVIGSDVAGIAEQIEDRKNGMLFKFQSSSSLKKVILFLIENPSFINYLKSNIVYPDTFSTVTEQMIKIYENLFSTDPDLKAPDSN